MYLEICNGESCDLLSYSFVIGLFPRPLAAGPHLYITRSKVDRIKLKEKEDGKMEWR